MNGMIAKRVAPTAMLVFFGVASLPAPAQTLQTTPKPSPGLMTNPATGKALYKMNCAAFPAGGQWIGKDAGKLHVQCRWK